MLVWNLFTGSFDTAPILFIDKDEQTEYEIIHLYFSDGTSVKVIGEHGFFNVGLNEYVFLRNDADKYIGDRFNKQTIAPDGTLSYTEVILTDVDVYSEQNTPYSPVTAGHLCYYVNGLLSMPGATTGLINIFTVNPGTMRYDNDLYLSDITEYGLFTYAEFCDIIPIEIFEAFQGQYLSVSIGKGLITWDGIEMLIERYEGFFG